MHFASLPGGSDLRLARIHQRFERPQVTDVQAAVHDAVAGSGVQWTPGASVAVAVGSRGIANLPTLVHATLRALEAAGTRPFIVPAMGSHGGATAAGQTALLAELGITEAAMGCAIRSSMDTVELPSEGLGHGLYQDVQAAKADAIVLINRVKPHTDFHGSIESGLAKMAVIGLGKERQAFELHRFGAAGLREFVPRAAARLLAQGKIRLGIGVVENAYDETAWIEAVTPDRLLARESELLEMARRWMPHLPVPDIDLLIVDRLGKDISGTGLDTNVIGRIRIATEPEPASPRVRSLVVLGLTPASHGNATGTGLADVISRRLFEAIDFGVTYKNIVTSGFLERAKVPLVAATDRDAVAIALRGLGHLKPGTERIVRIQDTLHLGEVQVSPAILAELRKRPEIEVRSELSPVFDAEGTVVGW